MKLGLWLVLLGGVLSQLALSVIPWQTFELAEISARALELGLFGGVMLALMVALSASAIWGLVSGRRTPASAWALGLSALGLGGLVFARSCPEMGLELMPSESIAIGGGWVLALLGTGLALGGALITRHTLCAWDESSPLLRVLATRARGGGRREVVLDRVLYEPGTLSLREAIGATSGGLVELPRITVTPEGDAWYTMGERARVRLRVGETETIRCDAIEVMCAYLVPSGVIGGRVPTKTLSRTELLAFGAAGLVAIAGLALVPILTWTEEAELVPACRDGACPGVIAKATEEQPEEQLAEVIVPDEVAATEERSASKAIEGPEGRMGDPTLVTPRELVVPRVDGPKVKRVDPRRLGLNAIIEQQLADSTSVAEVFRGDIAATTSRIASAMDGEGTELVLGPGTGLAFQGDGEGGPGDDGPGRIMAMGDIDTGPGAPTVAVKLGDPPKRQVRVDDGPVSQHGYCKESNLRSVVRRRHGAIRSCYERRLQLQGSLRGKITVRWTVGLDGKVQSATTVGDTLGDPETARCVLGWVRRMRFDPPDGGMCVVQWPFAFTSSP